MIRGSLKEKLEYEQYVRQCDKFVEARFYLLYRKSVAISKALRIKWIRENKQPDKDDISIHNFYTLLAECVSRVLGLCNIWFWNEAIPNVLIESESHKAEYYISSEEIGELLINQNRQIFSTSLIKANLNPQLLKRAIRAYDQRDLEALIGCIDEISLDDIYSQVVILRVLDDFDKQFNILELFEIDNHNEISVIRSGFQDIISITDKLESKNDKIDAITENFKLLVDIDFSAFIIDTFLNQKVCAVIYLIYCFFECELGKTDPIVETLKKIIDGPVFSEIAPMYVNSEDNLPELDDFLAKVESFLNLFSEGTSEQDAEDNIGGNINPHVERNEYHSRLAFPTRISRNRPMELDIKNKILDGLYIAFGYNLENYEGDPITKEEFKYLFGGPCARPLNYKTPYYWNQSDLQFAGLLRLLYFAQPQKLITLFFR